MTCFGDAEEAQAFRFFCRSASCERLDKLTIDSSDITPLTSPALRLGTGQTSDLTLRNGGSS
jgi:hypothetical protein